MHEEVNMKIDVIVNQAAGKKSNTKKIDQLKTRLRESFTEVNLLYTNYPGHAEQLAALSDADMLLSMGGDGTFNEVLNGNTRVERPIAYLPDGTTNDYARSLHIPKRVKPAVDLIKTGQTKLVDIGLANHRRFVYVAACGCFIEAVLNTSSQLKRHLGFLAYAWNVFRQLFHMKTYKIKVVTDAQVLEREILSGFIMNTYSVAGYHHLTKLDVDLADGFFEVVLMAPVHHLSDALRLLTALIKGDFSEPAFTVLKLNHCTIESEQPLLWTVDGEALEPTTRLNFEVCPKSLKIICNQT